MFANIPLTLTTHLLFHEKLCRHNHERNTSFSSRLRSNQGSEKDDALAEGRCNDQKNILSVIEVFAVCELVYVK
jgi:hypothetical protein